MVKKISLKGSLKQLNIKHILACRTIKNIHIEDYTFSNMLIFCFDENFCDRNTHIIHV